MFFVLYIKVLLRCVYCFILEYLNIICLIHYPTKTNIFTNSHFILPTTRLVRPARAPQCAGHIARLTGSPQQSSGFTSVLSILQSTHSGRTRAKWPQAARPKCRRTHPDQARPRCEGPTVARDHNRFHVFDVAREPNKAESLH